MENRLLVDWIDESATGWPIGREARFLPSVRRYPGDCQLLQCPADLRRWQFFPALPQSTAVSFRFLRSLKDRRFVGVERQWPLVLLQIAFQQVHVLHCGVAGHKSREPPAGRIDRKRTRLNSIHLVISYALFF